MPPTLALVGLSPDDRALLHALVQLGAGKGPVVDIVDEPAQAQYVLADVTDGPAVRRLREGPWHGSTVLLGLSDGGTGWPVVPRPLRLQALIEALRHVTPAALPAPAPPDAVDGDEDEDEDDPMVFAHTRPFSPSEMPDDGGFPATRQFAPDHPPPRPASVRRPHYEPLVLPPRPAPDPSPATGPVQPAGVGASPATAPAAETAPTPAAAPLSAAASSDPVLAAAAPAPGPSPARPRPVSPATEVDPWADPRDFDLTTPAIEDTGPSTVPIQPAATATRPSHRQGAHARILLVGDTRADWAPLVRSLSRAGFRLDIESNRDQALRRLADTVYGVFILDELFLARDTLPLCGEIRRAQAEADHPRARVLVLARAGGLFNRFRAWMAGCDGWMVVPLKKGDLMRFLGVAE